jgi:hypothetical protein
VPGVKSNNLEKVNTCFNRNKVSSNILSSADTILLYQIFSANVLMKHFSNFNIYLKSCLYPDTHRTRTKRETIANTRHRFILHRNGHVKPYKVPASRDSGACRNLVPVEQKNQIARFLQAPLVPVEQKNEIARFLQAL